MLVSNAVKDGMRQRRRNGSVERYSTIESKELQVQGPSKHRRSTENPEWRLGHQSTSRFTERELRATSLSKTCLHNECNMPRSAEYTQLKVRDVLGLKLQIGQVVTKISVLMVSSLATDII